MASLRVPALVFLFAASLVALAVDRRVFSRPSRPREVARAVRAVNGIYLLCQEAVWQSTTLILEDGTYRYSTGSDVILPDPPDYPIRGPYTVEGETILLDMTATPRAQRETMRWTLGSLNGRRVLWRDDGLRHYRETGRVHIYSVLVYVGAPDGSVRLGPARCAAIGIDPPGRPSAR